MARDLIEQNRAQCKELPEMQKLPNDMWRNFVMELFDTGFNNATKALAAAGCHQNPSSMRVTAHRMIHDGRVQIAIDAVSRVYLNALKPMALQILRDHLDPQKTPQLTGGERNKAAEMVLSRTGMNAVQEHKHVVEQSADNPDQMARIKMMAEQMGLDPEKLLGSRLAKIIETKPVKVVDVEYEDEPDLEDLV